MQYDAETPTKYLEQLEQDWRKEKLLAIRELLLHVAPELEETIHYKMLGYRKEEEFLFHLNAQKGYVSLYVGNVGKVDPDGQILKKVSFGKGCIRFKKSASLQETGVEEFLERFMELHSSGRDLGC